MIKYQYVTKQFGISDDGIHFLRKHYPYKTIPFSDVDTVELKRGMQLNNWPVIFLIGFALLIPGLYMMSNIVALFDNNGILVVAVRVLYYMSIPLFGAYFIYESLQYGPVLEVNYKKDKTKRFPLQELNEGVIQLNEILDSKLGSRFTNRLIE